MALFNRNNKTDVPPEIQEYYQTERRERAGIAWLLAFGTLVITIVLAAGIFFAGRWAYRKIAGDNNGAPTTQVAQNDEQQQEEQPSDTSGQTEEDRKAQEDRQAEEQRQAEEDRKAEEARKAEEEKQREAQQQAEQTPAGQVGGDTDERQVAVTGDSIPNTGPGDTVAIFLAVSVLGYLTHRLYAAKSAK